MTGKGFIFINSLFLLLSVFAACGSAADGNDLGSAGVDVDIPPHSRPQKQAERQIEEHSFEVELDGWGKVMFAPLSMRQGKMIRTRRRGPGMYSLSF